MENREKGLPIRINNPEAHTKQLLNDYIHAHYYVSLVANCLGVSTDEAAKLINPVILFCTVQGAIEEANRIKENLKPKVTMENTKITPINALTFEQISATPLTMIAYINLIASMTGLSYVQSGYHVSISASYPHTVEGAIQMAEHIRDGLKPKADPKRVMAPYELDYAQLSVSSLNEYAWQELVARLIGLPSATNAPEIRSEQYKEWTIETALKEADRIHKAHIDTGAFSIKKDTILDKADQLALLELWVDGKVQDDRVYHSKLTPGNVYGVGAEITIVDFLERLKGIVHEKFHQEGAESVREGLKKGIENFVNSL